MGIWSRLENVVKSYINEGTGKTTRDYTFRNSNTDDDYNAAYEELEDFLKNEKAEKKTEQKTETNNRRPIPAELKADFAELDLPTDATESECKEAYKRLLKKHHPDRHARNPELMKQATEKTARLNASYDRLEKWFKMR